MVNNTSELPLILAGPILRRIEGDKCALWLVTTTPCNIKVSFHTQGDIIQDFNLKPKDEALRLMSAGEKLHYHLIDLTFDAPLPQDTRIDYDLALCPVGKRKYRSLTQEMPYLCYEGESLPGFILPSRVHSLLHGSCRKPHHDSADGLLEADKLLEKLILTQDQKTDTLPDWPSFLIMSGDQIYADDVAGPMLHAIHQAIDLLGLGSEDFSSLKAPQISNSSELYRHHEAYYGRAEILPASDKNRDLMDILFEGVKKPIFTTDTANNHLISLHENLMMYLMVWSPVLWQFVDMDCPTNLTSEDRETYLNEKAILEKFVSGLGRVQRLFAHISVAMIFDDHDVTDDWNLNRQWEEAVYNHPFSKRMVANSLIAYLLNQGWGNNPNGFDESIYEGLSLSLNTPGGKDHSAFCDKLLSFQGWEYEWHSQPPLIVIDTRTRRWRSESSMVKPSGLLDWEALVDLQHKLFDQKSVLLVSPAPIYGMKLIETIQRVFTWFGKPLMVDAENWMAHPGTANSILNIFMHSKTPQNFVILSGDVHYSFVYDVEAKKHAGGPDIWQVTSSGLKNEFPKKLLDWLDILNRWLYAPKSPLNWFTKRKHLRIVPRKPEGHADGRRLYNHAGIGLVELDQDGRPYRFRQLSANGPAIEFHRMENHTRWQ